MVNFTNENLTDAVVASFDGCPNPRLKTVVTSLMRHAHAVDRREPMTPLRLPDSAQSLQALLGHDKLGSTARYTRVATGMIAAVTSPLDLLAETEKTPNAGGRPRLRSGPWCDRRWRSRTSFAITVRHGAPPMPDISALRR
jgi:hypothetical protein